MGICNAFSLVAPVPARIAWIQFYGAWYLCLSTVLYVSLGLVSRSWDRRSVDTLVLLECILYIGGAPVSLHSLSRKVRNRLAHALNGNIALIVTKAWFTFLLVAIAIYTIALTAQVVSGGRLPWLTFMMPLMRLTAGRTISGVHRLVAYSNRLPIVLLAGLIAFVVSPFLFAYLLLLELVAVYRIVRSTELGGLAVSRARYRDWVVSARTAFASGQSKGVAPVDVALSANPSIAGTPNFPTMASSSGVVNDHLKRVERRSRILDGKATDDDLTSDYDSDGNDVLFPVTRGQAAARRPAWYSRNAAGIFVYTKNHNAGIHAKPELRAASYGRPPVVQDLQSLSPAGSVQDDE